MTSRTAHTDREARAMSESERAEMKPGVTEAPEPLIVQWEREAIRRAAWLEAAELAEADAKALDVRAVRTYRAGNVAEWNVLSAKVATLRDLASACRAKAED